MTRQLISTNKQPLLRSPHAKRPPQSGFVQARLPDSFLTCQMGDTKRNACLNEGSTSDLHSVQSFFRREKKP